VYHQELANLAAYLVSDFSAYVNGEVVVIDGGEWLKAQDNLTFLKLFRRIMGSTKMMIKAKRINKQIKDKIRSAI
jgi:hypothetical protein